MSIHKGEILRKIFTDTRQKVSAVAKKMGIDRGTIYRHFEDPELSVDYILRYAKALSIDMSKYFPELNNVGDDEMRHMLRNKPSYEELEIAVDFWKDKYIALLEDYNNLLLERIN